MAAPGGDVCVTVPGVDVHVRDLRYFVAVADELSFTRAAERLFVAQPSLSRQIAALERALRVALFERGPRGVTLTAPGEALLPTARQLLADWEHAQRDVAAAAASQSAALTVGLATGVGRGLLAALARELDANHPGLRLRMRQVPWDDPTAGLADRSTDVAFAFLPLPVDAGLSWQVIATEPRQIALPDGHRLAGRSRIEFAELLDEPFLAVPAAPARDFWLATEQRGGRPAVIVGEVRTAEEAFEAIAGGVGVALVATGNARLYERAGIVFRDVDGVGPSQLALTWRSDDHREAVQSFTAACARAKALI